MKNNNLTFMRSSFVILCSFLCFVPGIRAQITQTISFTGTVQTFVVPSCVSTITVELFGAQGASQIPGGTGGLGAYTKGVIPVTTGQVLNIYVGGQNGYNGGGTGGINGNATFGGPTNGNAGVGGGATDIRIGGTALSNRIIVAGGGGGGARNGVWTGCQTAGPAGNGGAGGGLIGGTGTTGASSACNCAGTGGNGGAGGSQIAGGASGSYNGLTCLQTWAVGGAGVLGIGGSGSLVYHNGTGGGGGGGGGYYGGGSGANGSDTTPGGGGGGGSCYTGAATNTAVTAGVQTGDGLVLLKYFYNGAGVLAGATSLSICAGNTITLNGSNVLSYTWTPGGSNAASIAVSPSVNTTYTVEGTNNLGCISFAVLTVSVNAGLPALSVVTSSNTICQNKPVTLTASGATTYTWTGGVTNGTTFFPPSTSGYTVTGENACGTSTVATSVTVNPLPNITASINNPTVCSGGSIILNGGNSASGYTWNPNVPNNTAIIPANTINYTVTGVGANGCTNTAVTGVTVLITPTITPVVTPTAICVGATATLSALGATGYTWIPGTNPNTSTVQVSPPGPTTYTVLRSNGACSSSSTVNLVVNPLPLVNASATPSQICIGTGVNLVVVGPITNTWLPGGFTASNFTLYPNFSQNYTVTGSNGNCTATAIVTVVVNPTPTLSISSATTTICQGNNITLTAGGAQTYTWLPSGGTNITELISPPSTTIITLQGINSFSCTTSKTQLIIVNALPNMSLTSSLPYICAGNTAALAIASQSANVVYSWSTGQNGPNISVSPIVTTNYFATGTNTITGCVNTNTITLAVYISTFTAISGTAICKGETVTLTASGAAPSYSWTGGIMSPSIAVSPLVNTTYYVTGLNVSCSNTQAITVTVNPLPNVTASVAKSQICKFEIATISGNGASTYSWNTGVTTQVLTFTLGVTTTYTLTGTDNNGCSKTTTVTQFVATCIGVEETEATSGMGLYVYPNPNKGEFTVKLNNASDKTLEILDITGRVLLVQKIPEDKVNISMSNLANGIYYVRVRTNVADEVFKIIKE